MNAKTLRAEFSSTLGLIYNNISADAEHVFQAFYTRIERKYPRFSMWAERSLAATFPGITKFVKDQPALRQYSERLFQVKVKSALLGLSLGLGGVAACMYPVFFLTQAGGMAGNILHTYSNTLIKNSQVRLARIMGNVLLAAYTLAVGLTGGGLAANAGFAAYMGILTSATLLAHLVPKKWEKLRPLVPIAIVGTSWMTGWMTGLVAGLTPHVPWAMGLIGTTSVALSDQLSHRRRAASLLILPSLAAYNLFCLNTSLTGYWGMFSMFLLNRTILKVDAPVFDANGCRLRGLQRLGAWGKSLRRRDPWAVGVTPQCLQSLLNPEQLAELRQRELGDLPCMTTPDETRMWPGCIFAALQSVREGHSIPEAEKEAMEYLPGLFPYSAATQSDILKDDIRVQLLNSELHALHSFHLFRLAAKITCAAQQAGTPVQLNDAWATAFNEVYDLGHWADDYRRAPDVDNIWQKARDLPTGITKGTLLSCPSLLCIDSLSLLGCRTRSRPIREDYLRLLARRAYVTCKNNIHPNVLNGEELERVQAQLVKFKYGSPRRPQRHPSRDAEAVLPTLLFR
jgi:hypothetical protein